MADGERYQLTLFGTYLGQPANNVFYYKAAGGAAIAIDLASSWESTRKGPLMDCVVTDYSLESIQVLNVDDPADFGFQPVTSGNIGTRTGDGLPRAICYTFQYIRATRASRHGWKRFAGVSESDQNDGVATGTILTNLAALATVLGQTISAVGTTFQPIIFRYYSVPPTTPPTVVLEDFPVSDVVYVHIGTQNTRKHL